MEKSKLIKWKLFKKVVCRINRDETVALFRNLADVERAFPHVSPTIEVDEVGSNYLKLHNILSTDEFYNLQVVKKLLKGSSDALAIMVFENRKCLVGAPMISSYTP